MAIRKDTQQLIITIDAKESAAYQKVLNNNKDLVKDIKKLEVGQEGYNEALQKTVSFAEKVKNTNLTKLNRKQLVDTKRALEQYRNILPATTFAELGFEKQLQRVNTQLSENNQRVRSTTQSMNRFNGFLKSGVKILAAYFAIDRVREFFSTLFKKAGELEGIQKKFSIVFGQSADIVEESAEKQALSLGLTIAEYKSATAAAADLLVPMKFTRSEAAELSVGMVNLSGALSEWSSGQRTASEVTEILNKALLGEREQLKTLGISISENDIKERLAAEGKEKLTGVLLQQAKAQATYQLLLEKSVDAQTSFANNADSLARSKSKLLTTLRQLTENMAKSFLPVFNRSAAALGKFVGNIKEYLFPAESAIQKTRSLQSQFNSQIGVLKRLNPESSHRAKLIKEINEKYGDYLPNLLSEKSSIEDITNAQKEANKSFEERIILIAFEEEYQKQVEKTKEAVKLLASVELSRAKAAQNNAEFIQKGASAGQAQVQRDIASNLNDFIKESSQKTIDESESTLAQIEEAYDRTAKRIGSSLDSIREKFKNLNQESPTPTNNSVAGGSRRIKVDVIPTIQSLEAPNNIDFAKQLNIELEDLNIEDYIAQRLNILQNGLDRELEEEEKSFLKRLVSQEEFEQQQLIIKSENFAERLQVLEDLGKIDSDLYHNLELEKLKTDKELSEKRLDIARREQELKSALYQESLETTKDVIGTAIGLLGDEEKARRKNSSAIKAFETAKVAVNAQSEISEIYKRYAGIPGGFVIGAIRAGLVLARSIQSINKINTQKFAESGKVLDRPTGLITALGNIPIQSNGDNILATVKTGEVVLNEQHQAAAGGPEFFRRLGVPGFADSGLVQSVNAVQAPSGLSDVNISSGSNTDSMATQAMLEAANAIKQLPETLRFIKSYVSLTDIEDGLNTKDDLERLSGY